jgi:hypothetical protein
VNWTCSRHEWEGTPKCRLLAGKSERKGPQGGPKYPQEENIKLNIAGKILNLRN